MTMKAYLATEGEESRDYLGNVLLLPQIDGLENVDIVNSIILESFLEPKFGTTQFI